MIDDEAAGALPGRRLFGWIETAAATMIAVMVAAILFQVVARYAFAHPPFWTEELARYAMVWAGMLGAAAAFRRMVDPRLIEPGTILRGKAAPAGKALAVIPAMIFSATLLFLSLLGPNMDPARSFMARNLSRSSEALQINMGFVAAAVPVMALLVLTAGFLRLWTLAKSRGVATDRPAADGDPALLLAATLRKLREADGQPAPAKKAAARAR
jgi:TRAP-type C4-dicarboxylate transport system permease small subunit